MKMIVRIEDGDEITEEIVIFSELQAAELRLLKEVSLHFLASKMPPQKHVAQASIIPGLISIGTDALLKKWGDVQLRRHLTALEY